MIVLLNVLILKVNAIVFRIILSWNVQPKLYALNVGPNRQDGKRFMSSCLKIKSFQQFQKLKPIFRALFIMTME